MSPAPFVHPDARQMIDRATASSEPALETQPPADARRIADARVMAGIERLGLPSVNDVTTRPPHGQMTLRIYRPSDGHLPFAMYFHGGGFMFGNLETHDALCRALAKRSGVALVAVDFRLSPEHRFPAAPDDCLFATQWALDHAAELGLDASRFAIAGESSGGNLAAVVTQRLLAAGGARPRLQALLHPLLDMRLDSPSIEAFGTGYLLTRARMEYYLRHYLARPQDADDPAASPGRYASRENTPPTFLIAAGLDPLLSDADEYATRLQQLNVPVRYTRYEGWPHGFLFWGHTDGSQRAIAETGDALREALRDSV